MEVPHYYIDVFYSEEDGCYIANVPDLKYCSAHGETPEEALAEGKIALELWIESCLEDGDPIPEARYRPAAEA
jgi:predicted RNase H-like HicB family nuclease